MEPVQGDCLVLRPGQGVTGKQGLDYLQGVSAETAGARGICLQTFMIPAGGRARAHLHEGHESAIYVMRGEVVLWYGDRLEHRLDGGPGDFFYVPAGVPHLPVNPSPTEPVEAVIARTDPSDQERVVPLPELDVLPHIAVPPAAADGG